MSLDITLTRTQPADVFWSNITHNLNGMAVEAGIYESIWRPEELGITKAGSLIEPLEKAILLLESDPERFRKYNAKNGWGTYEQFLEFVKEYYQACLTYPNAEISVSR